MSLAPGLTMDTFDADGDAERLRGWMEAQSRGFHQGRTTEEHREHFARHLVADAVLLRGVWQEEPALGSGAIPVATYCSFDKTLNAGHAMLTVRMISDVTVSPTHRRRGLLRTLMTEDLRDAAERGVPVAALTASEGSIYGRFGFGPAVFQHAVTVDTGPRFALRGLDDDGSVELLEPEEAWPTVAAVFGAFHERTRGSLARPQFYEPLLNGSFDFDGGPDRKLRTAVHVDARGVPDGYVVFRPGERKERHRPVEVSDLVALTSAAHLRLWRFLADIDLTDAVEWSRAPVEDPLPWALTDPYLFRVNRLADALWVRVLDVPRALEARPWGRDGTLVMAVEDPLGHAAGSFAVTTTNGRAVVAPSADAADVRLDADTLGALYLGGVRAETLRRAGRLIGSDSALDEWSAMTDAGPAPCCLTHF